VLPWLKGKEHARVQTMREYLRVAFDRIPIAADRRNKLRRALHECLGYPARWRLRHDVYAFPIELWAREKLSRIVALAKPSVDAKRLEPAAQTSCA
jgi:hypothetical protein